MTEALHEPLYIWPDGTHSSIEYGYTPSLPAPRSSNMTIEHLALVDDITRLDVGNIILLVDFDASDYPEDDHRGWCHDVCRVTQVQPGTAHKVPFILVQTLEREARGGPADEELCIGQYSPGTPPYLDFGGGGLFNCGIVFLSTASPAW